MEDSSGKQGSLFDQLLEYFDVAIAQDEGHLAEVFHVRYRVYCEEFGYEPKEAFANREESDEFDERSLHCMIRHRGSGRVAAIARVVTVAGNQKLPLELHCGDHLDPDFMARFSNRRETICEISRLAVDGDFRRRRGEQESRYGDTEALSLEASERRTFPLLGLSAMLSSFACASLIGRPNLVAIMEPFLPVILRRSGIYLTRFGEDFEHRGKRAPYYLDTTDFVDGMRDDVRDFYTRIRDTLSQFEVPEASGPQTRTTPTGAPPTGGTAAQSGTGLPRALALPGAGPMGAFVPT
ncbi:MAG: PEP-CTERM/exosortase system-associated acyltransferase [Halieaceae bacterium]|jgi:N-acyl amino acid synthase of PEP-CTERM/exosortase system|nr:PEP-CTERM/exosortase system-associated acyltransferase [Halieaceae bacterium]